MRHCGTVAKSVTYVELARDESWALLRGCAAGRVIYARDALPAAALVNYALVDDLIVFSAGERSKLAGLLSGQVVAFEVDDVDPATGTGWSVLVVGRSARVTEAAIKHRLPPLALYPSSMEGPEAYVGVSGTKVTGRVWDGFHGLLAGQRAWGFGSEPEPPPGRTN